MPEMGGSFRAFPEKFRWSSARGALWYVVRLSGPIPPTEMRVCGEQVSIAEIQADLMPDGHYEIEVTAANPKGHSEWLKGGFTVEHF